MSNNNKHSIKIGRYAKIDGAYTVSIRSQDKKYTAKLIVYNEDHAYRLHYMLSDLSIDLLEVIKHKAGLTDN